MSPQPLCLFIAPLKGDDSATRERSEDVYASLVVPAAKLAGFDPDFVLDDEPGTIMNHVVRSIKAARVVVADLTGNNFSVGYEFGFAHMIKKPTIPIIKCGSAKPFDVQTMRAVEYDYANRGALRAAIPQLAEQLKRVIRTAPVMTDNPLQNALKAVEPPKQAPPLPVIPPTLPPPDIGGPPRSASGVALRTLAGLGVPAEPEPSTPLSHIAGLGQIRHGLGYFDAPPPSLVPPVESPPGLPFSPLQPRTKR